MLRSFAEELMSAEADAVCGEPGETSRSGRTRRRDAGAGSIDLKIPKLLEGSYLPDWLLDARRQRCPAPPSAPPASR